MLIHIFGLGVNLRLITILSQSNSYMCLYTDHFTSRSHYSQYIYPIFPTLKNHVFPFLTQQPVTLASQSGYIRPIILRQVTGGRLD